MIEWIMYCTHVCAFRCNNNTMCICLNIILHFVCTYVRTVECTENFAKSSRTFMNTSWRFTNTSWTFISFANSSRSFANSSRSFAKWNFAKFSVHSTVHTVLLITVWHLTFSGNFMKMSTHFHFARTCFTLLGRDTTCMQCSGKFDSLS